MSWELLAVIVVLFVGLCAAAGALLGEMEKRDAAEAALRQQHDRQNTALNWLSLHLDQRHPCVRVVCKAVEAALQTGEMPDYRAVHEELEALRHAERLRFAAQAAGRPHSSTRD